MSIEEMKVAAIKELIGALVRFDIRYGETLKKHTCNQGEESCSCLREQDEILARALSLYEYLDDAISTPEENQRYSWMFEKGLRNAQREALRRLEQEVLQEQQEQSEGQVFPFPTKPSS